MWQGIGALFVLGGVTGILYNWVEIQKKRQMRLEEFIKFIHKSIYAMESEKVKIVDFFLQYSMEYDKLLECTLHEIGMRLQTNTYLAGQIAWIEVFEEKKKDWMLKEEMFDCILRTGNGFFGRSIQENTSILEKCLQELEEIKKESKVKEIQERKVWIPVGMLGGMMIIILFI